MLAHAKFWPLMAVVSFALLMDYFIYGVVTTLPIILATRRAKVNSGYCMAAMWWAC